MKNKRLYLIVILFVICLLPTTVYARGLFEDEVVFGNFTLESGESLRGNLVIVGGVVELEKDSIVYGDVVLVGGTVHVNGEITRNLVGIGGVVELLENAVIRGDLFTLGATLEKDSEALIFGQIINSLKIPYNIQIPDEINLDNIQVPKVPIIQVSRLGFNAFWFIFRTLIWSGLSVLLVLFFHPQVNRISQAAVSQPLIIGGAGLLTIILAPFVIIALSITIILIPVSLIIILVLFIAWLLGFTSIGMEVGHRISKLLKQEWAPAIEAGVGTFVLLFILSGLTELIPCIGFLSRSAVGVWGLGAVLLTKFGTEPFQSVEKPLQPSTEAELPVIEDPKDVVEEQEIIDSQASGNET